MKARVAVFVAPRGSGRWEVRLDGRMRAWRVFKRRQMALRTALSRAARDGLTIYVFRTNGAIGRVIKAKR